MPPLPLRKNLAGMKDDTDIVEVGIEVSKHHDTINIDRLASL